jgi:predicted transcriptional regulator
VSKHPDLLKIQFALRIAAIQASLGLGRSVWQWYGTGMAMNKVTFTLDEQTVHWIDDAAERLAKPKSQVVREAVADYHSRIGRLSESERKRMLNAFDALVPAIPTRPLREAEDEMREIRRARRSGGRLSTFAKRK